jgi:hypothetical protein
VVAKATRKQKGPAGGSKRKLRRRPRATSRARSGVVARDATIAAVGGTSASL